jgi:hypothetical protein
MRKAVVPILVFLALAAVIGFVATSGGGDAEMSTGGQEVAGGEGMAVEDAASGAAAREPSSDGGGSLRGVGDVPLVGLSVVKTASVSLVVPRDGFEDAFSDASAIAGRLGGFVESSSQGGTRSRFGELVVRVPNQSFDAAMAELRQLGEVESQEFTAEDVSAQFVDLEARLRTWEAQETVLLGLMRQATSVAATLQVQRELQEVQFRIEQIKGSLRMLEDQTDFSTIRVSLREQGAAPLLQRRAADDRPSLAEAWDRAVNGFLGVLYATVVGLGYLIPIAALCAIAWFGFRRLRPATS